jgi:hypothetical protein
MRSHVIAAAPWARRHRYEITLATALALTTGVLVVATPILLTAAAVEWKHGRRRSRLLSLALILALARAVAWLSRELRNLPHGRWHPCGQCGAPIQAPSRAAYCSHPCRTYARLERNALDNDPRIAARAQRRLHNLRLRELADSDPQLEEVPF